MSCPSLAHPHHDDIGVEETATERLGCTQTSARGDYGDDCVVCAVCETSTPLDDTVVGVAGDDLCSFCANSGYWQCDFCDAWNPDDDDYCGNGCSDRHDLIYDYNYKPTPEFHGTGPLFLGVEIEIHTPEGVDDQHCIDLATSHLSELGYLKEDESVLSGFEIVTHPMSYDWAMTNFPWRLFPDLAHAGCSTSASTGLHVHLSRAGFDSAAHIYRWMKLLYRNRERVIRLARRYSPDYAAFTHADRLSVKDYAKGAHGKHRHSAINTTNDDTLELRVFASSLDPATIQAALGLAAASVEYTRHLSVPQLLADGWTWPAFTAWVGPRPEYHPLRRQIASLAGVSSPAAQPG